MALKSGRRNRMSTCVSQPESLLTSKVGSLCYTGAMAVHEWWKQLVEEEEEEEEVVVVVSQERQYRKENSPSLSHKRGVVTEELASQWEQRQQSRVGHSQVSCLELEPCPETQGTRTGWQADAGEQKGRGTLLSGGTETEFRSHVLDTAERRYSSPEPPPAALHVVCVVVLPNTPFHEALLYPRKAATAAAALGSVWQRDADEINANNYQALRAMEPDEGAPLGAPDDVGAPVLAPGGLPPLARNPRKPRLLQRALYPPLGSPVTDGPCWRGGA
ncbi:unnamed protein product [Gadus morhua 'NCC']